MKTNKDLSTLYKYYMELADKIIERQEQIGEPPDEWETIDILRGRLLCFSQILDDEVKSEQKAVLIIQLIVSDDLRGDLEPLTVWEVAERQAEELGYSPVPNWLFEETGLTEEAFTVFLQENGYKPTEGEDYLYIGTEEGLEKYIRLKRYLNFTGGY